MLPPSADIVLDDLSKSERLWLFLDYDGTLAEFAPTPDIVLPDAELITLLSEVSQKPNLRLALISGRRLGHVRKLIPIPGIWLAGTYGVELLAPDGRELARLDYAMIRPKLNQLKPEWENLLADRPGFYLEDKGWSLAIHASRADDRIAEEIISSGKNLARNIVINSDALHIHEGEKFLEISPVDIDKGYTVEYILSQDDFEAATPIFIGDDDKDERAFSEIKKRGGIPILVAQNPRPTNADYCLANPFEVRLWLSELSKRI